MQDAPSSPPTTPTPISFLKQAIKAVPAVRFALGIGGVVAVVAIVKAFGLGLGVTFLSIIVMLVLMTVLVIFARLTRQKDSVFRIPALVLTWFCLILFMAVAGVLFSSAFFGKPDLNHIWGQLRATSANSAGNTKTASTQEEPLVVTAVGIPIDFQPRAETEYLTERGAGCACSQDRSIIFPMKSDEGIPAANQEFLFRYDGSQICRKQGIKDFHGTINWGASVTVLHDFQPWTFQAIAGTLKAKFSKPGVYNVVADFSVACIDYHGPNQKCENTCSAHGATQVHILAATETPKKSGDATTTGPNSPAVTGDGNQIQYNESSPDNQKPTKKKKE